MKEEWIIAFAYVNKTIEKKEQKQKQKQMTHCVSTWHKLQKKRLKNNIFAWKYFGRDRKYWSEFKTSYFEYGIIIIGQPNKWCRDTVKKVKVIWTQSTRLAVRCSVFWLHKFYFDLNVADTYLMVNIYIFKKLEPQREIEKKTHTSTYSYKLFSQNEIESVEKYSPKITITSNSWNEWKSTFQQFRRKFDLVSHR